MPEELTNTEKELLKEAKKENKVQYTATFPNLIDLVENDDGELEFLIFDPVTGKCSTTKVVQREGKTYEPPPKDSLPADLLFPRYSHIKKYYREREDSHLVTNGDDMRIDKSIYNNYEFDISLYDDIALFLQERAELPNDKLYDVLVLWVFHTYAMEKADFSPIIYFLGLPEKGKSRMLKSLTYIARRGIRKIGITDAQILRDCTHLDATLAMDMKNLWKKLSESGSEDVFLNRPERGVTVSRVNRPDRGPFRDTDYYVVFGPTIFATNELIDEILDTRAIPIIMRKSKKLFPRRIKPTEGLILKEKLTAWRMGTYGLSFPETEPIAMSRLGDITQPLADLVRILRPDRESVLKEIITDIEIKRIKEKADTISGQIIRAVVACGESVDHGTLESKVITDYFNKERKEKEMFSSRKILGKLKTMGFETRTVHGGLMGIDWNIELIDSLCLEFGIENNGNNTYPNLSSFPQQSSPNVTKPTEEELPYYADIDKLTP